MTRDPARLIPRVQGQESNGGSSVSLHFGPKKQTKKTIYEVLEEGDNGGAIVKSLVI